MRLLLPRRAQRVADVIDAREYRVDRVRVRVELAAAQVVQHILELVGEAADLREAEAAGRALDRMNRPKNRVQQLGRALAAFQPDQVRFRCVKAFEALREETGVELLQVN